MLQFESDNGPSACDRVTRRDFLRVGALSAGAVGLSLADLNFLQAGGHSHGDVNCIVLFLVGGPSQLDTWDLKPDAPAEIRGPFLPIRTNVPGIAISECFPLMARVADRYSLVRSVHHEAAPIHETGHQLMQTGKLFRGGLEHPHYGAVLSHLRGPRPGGSPPFVVLPGPIGSTGVSVSHGQTAGYLGDAPAPLFVRAAGSVDPARLESQTALVDAVDALEIGFEACNEFAPRDKAVEAAITHTFSGPTKQALDVADERDGVRARYGMNTFGQSCLLARRLVERGTRLVTVNMFDSVFDTITWDCHADGGSLPATLDDYRDTLCPMFDRAYTALLGDLEQRNMLESTLVVAMGEFGRTPQLNLRGGRDHWPGCWTILFAGGGVRGGRLIGASNASGAEPVDRPVTPAQVAATVYRALGVDLHAQLPGPDGRPIPLVEAGPIEELF
ncbi:MAG TPA: DUF1501 domain-containing protein [Gemmataceae bacterium]|nr:DUF1501 domain-containing protein [Gemmataceae bacterium]